jgi:hypothetical protein
VSGDRVKGEIGGNGREQQRGEQHAARAAREWSFHVLSAVMAASRSAAVKRGSIVAQDDARCVPSRCSLGAQAANRYVALDWGVCVRRRGARVALQR